MNDPKRWLDEGGGGTFEERALLDAGRSATMPTSLRKRVWVGVATGAASLGALGEAAGATGAAVAGKGAGALLIGSSLVKGAIAVAFVGGVGLGVAALRSPSNNVETRAFAPTPTISMPQAALAPAPFAEGTLAPTAIAESSVPQAPSPFLASRPTRGMHAVRAAPLPIRSAAPKALGVSGGDARTASEAASPVADEAEPRDGAAVTRLREEAAAVLAARRALLAGDAREALRMLERAQVAFPHGALLEEREALAVRALVASGQNDLARKRGEAFLQAFPRSPQASEVRAVIAP